MLNESWFVRYVESYYWASATMMLIGTKGQTQLETGFIIITLCFTVVIFAYILNNISEILTELNKDGLAYLNDLEIINKYMQSKNLSNEIQVKVRTYIQFYHQSKSEILLNQNAEQVIQNIPSNLRQSIKMDINQSIVKSFKNLMESFSNETIQNLHKIMEDVSYVNQETIFTSKAEQVQDQYVYLILKGEVILHYEAKEKNYSQQKQEEKNFLSNYLQNMRKQSVKNIKIENLQNNNEINASQKTFDFKQLNQGDIFGEESFFTGQNPYYSAICKNFANICRIKRQNFLQIIKKNHDDYERFCYIKDELLQKGITKFFSLNCFMCDSQFHNLQNCNLLNYSPVTYKIITLQNQIEKKNNQRKRYFRQIKKNEQGQKYQALELINTLKQMAYFFQDKYEDFFEAQNKIYNQNQIFSDSQISDEYFDSEVENLIKNGSEEEKQKQFLKEIQDSKNKNDHGHDFISNQNAHKFQSQMSNSIKYTSQPIIESELENYDNFIQEKNQENDFYYDDEIKIRQKNNLQQQQQQQHQPQFKSSQNIQITLQQQSQIQTRRNSFQPSININSPKLLKQAQRGQKKSLSSIDYNGNFTFQSNRKNIKNKQLSTALNKLNSNVFEKQETLQRDPNNKKSSYLNQKSFQSQNSQQNQLIQQQQLLQLFTVYGRECKDAYYLFFCEFDQMKQFKVYFTKYNFHYSYEKYQEYLQKRRDKLQQYKKKQSMYNKKLLQTIKQ